MTAVGILAAMSLWRCIYTVYLVSGDACSVSYATAASAIAVVSFLALCRCNGEICTHMRVASYDLDADALPCSPTL